MVKYLFMMVMLIPILNCWWLFTVSLLILSFFLLLFPSGLYFNGLSYGFGMDTFSYCMVFLTVWVIMLMLLASMQVKFHLNNMNEFMWVLYFMMFMLILTFSTTNLLMLYLFFESSMVPVLFLIFGWGYQPERLVAGLYLLFYTLFASLPLLLSIFFVYYYCNTLFIFLMYVDCNFFLYLGLILAFLVKMPLAFFHFWLPKAHVEAPVSGSMILAGVLLKLGGYGMCRVFFFIWYYSLKFSWFWIVFSLFGGLFLSILCLCQVDIKSLIAYSSVVHMSMVICGIMTLSYFGFMGSLVLMLGHGLCSSGLFALANIIYERSSSRSLFINSGYISILPLISMLWFLFIINNIASPISLNLLGECMLLNSLIGWSSLNMFFLGLMSFFSCCYSIYLYSITQHGFTYSGISSFYPGNYREFLLIFYHFVPLNFLFLKVDIFMLWL
uniref:NADH-ubiquinone oxidoreductase chain 4 n=1 Tax=Pyrrhopeplus carduelis TaxID=1928078 RepID=A0A4Y1JVQ0_9HEMI|nr:NADH dehydrogenase subunit 4 [Pyrrhopeplus carduelis]APO08814.1 NADH dehydrogenase subunit 4 [Pyrrhopeplus carduelis]